MNVYRRANASWYGPGLYGNNLACGGRLSAATRGVAHKTLPCGTRVTLRKGDRIVRTRVIDRGPFTAGREFDLTAAVRQSLGFGSTGTVEVSH
jgi:rare lipoprotein A